MNPKKQFFKIKPTISVTLIFLISFVVIISLFLQYYFSKDLALDATQSNFKLTAEKIEQKITFFDKTNTDVVKTIVHLKQINEFPKVDQRHNLLKVLSAILTNNPHVYAIYAGNK